MPHDPLIDYARAPEPMSRKRFALIIGTATVSAIAIGGIIYATSARRATVTAGIVAPPSLFTQETLVTEPSPGVTDSEPLQAPPPTPDDPATSER